MNVASGTLQKSSKSHQEADEQTYVFEGNDWLACVSIDEGACEGACAYEPCPD